MVVDLSVGGEVDPLTIECQVEGPEMERQLHVSGERREHTTDSSQKES